MSFPYSTRLLRRRALQALGALAATPSLWALPLQAKGQGRLIVVFLRGAYDGLSAFVPYADPQYPKLRNSIAIAPPDGSDKTALRLDDVFGLHPALAPLLPLWQQGVFSFVPAAGSPDPTRSHFEAQHHWEIGIPGKNSDASGWLNSLAGLQGAGSAASAIGVGEANPQILAGVAPVRLIPKGKAATRSGALGNERTRSAVMNLYAGSDKVSQAFRAGADSRMQTAQSLSEEKLQREMMAADNGAPSASGLALDAQHLGTLMRQDRRLRLGFLSAGGWDTHANQGNASGALATNLAGLGRAIVQLRRDFDSPGDVIVVMSEFGRTSAENGTRGTDHGHGNAMWLIGDAVQGGRWHGQWAGLASGNLHEGRDLPVLHDFRGVFAQLLRRNFALTDTQLANLFPGGAWDASLDGLMRS